jgi:gentisate 1,2-dioxygenase
MSNARAQQPTLEAGYSHKLYGKGGLLPAFVSHQRGFGQNVGPVFHYRAKDIRETLDALRGETGDPYEGITLRFVNPANGQPVFTTLDYSAQLVRPGEETRWKRETANIFYIALDGSGVTEVAGQRYEWERNDIIVVPNFLWRRHINTGKSDAVLYAVSDWPLYEKIGQYRVQGRKADGTVEQIVA